MKRISVLIENDFILVNEDNQRENMIIYYRTMNIKLKIILFRLKVDNILHTNYNEYIDNRSTSMSITK